MNFRTIKQACLAIAFCAPVVASAAIVSVNQTVDLTALNLNSSFVVNNYDTPDFTLNVGDTLKLTYDFLGSQTLKMQNPSQLYGWVMAADSDCVMFSSSGSLKLINAQGPVKAGSASDYSGCAHFGNVFSANQFTTGSGAIEFSGMEFTLTVDSYNNGVTSRNYAGPWLLLSGNGMSIGTEVPEPASLGLLGLALAGVAFSRRRA